MANTGLVANLIATVALTATYAPHVLFGRHLGDNDCANRYVWRPLRHSFEPPQAKGGITSPTGTPAFYARPLFTKSVDFEVHCWATGAAHLDTDDYAVTDTAEIMEAVLVTALRDALYVNYRPMGSEWGSPEWADHGVVLVHRFTAVSTLLETYPDTGLRQDPIYTTPTSVNLDVQFSPHPRG